MQKLPPASRENDTKAVYEAMVLEDLGHGRLTQVLNDWQAPASHFYLYYSSRRHVPPALQALIGFIRT
ncbi:LysR substrate-binding domain-containing protein [Pseudomonas sp. TE3610]